MKAKRILFWATFPVTAVLILLLSLIEGLAHGGTELIHKWEGWTGDYKDSGLHYIGGGIWSSME